MTDFTGQTAVVTGAAGGVGRAIAARLLASGAAVVMVGRREDALQRAMDAMGWRAAAVTAYAVDLAAEAEVQAFATTLATAAPEIHILVHSAGMISLGRIGQASLADFDRQYSVNVRAPYHLTRALLPCLATCRGQVVFVNSSAGINARAGVAQYAATKHALRAVADSLRDEVNELGVRVTSVFLGRTATAMQAAVHAHEGRPYEPARLIQPDDVASVVMAALQLPRTAELTDLHIRPMSKPQP
jgi:NADP-dependent 3-hydroxy acid dehydrogenase YdfG